MSNKKGTAFNMTTVSEYSRELNDFYCKIKDLDKAVPREFGYKLDSVLTAYNEMFSRFCPFKVGDKVQLTKTPEINKGSGWYGSKHFLIVGAIATIKECDWRKGSFVFALEFEEESYIYEGKVHQVSPERRHWFSFGESWIAAVEQKEISNPTEPVPDWFVE